MDRSTERILTTHCGSLARPGPLLELMRARHQGEAYDVEAYEEAVRSAVAECVRRQVAVGLDVVADGEQGRLGHASYVGERLAGFEPVAEATSRLDDFAAEAQRFPDYYERYFGRSMQGGAVVRPTPLRCTGPIAYRGEEALGRDLANLRDALARAGGRAAFVAAVAPSGVGSNAYYDTEEDYLFALADALATEYRAIVAAGFTLQIDDPFVTELCSYSTAPAAQRMERAECYVAAINRGLQGIPPDKVRFHTCYGINQGPRVSDVPLRDIIHLVLAVDAGAYSFESANPRHEHEYHLWEDVALPDDKVLVPGVVTHSTNIVEHPELVAERIVRFADRVGRERVVAGVDCGFSSQATSTPEIDPEVAWAKLEALCEGARLASERLWR